MDNASNDLYHKANEAFREGRWSEAETLLRQVSELKPYYADVFHKLGVIAHQNGDLKQAVAYFQKALALNPNYTEAQLNLAITYNAIGQYDNALEVFSGAVQQAILEAGPLDPHVKAKIANEHFKLGNIYYEFGVLQESLDQYAKAVKLCPGFPDIRTKYGVVLRDLGRFPEAVTEFQEVLRQKSAYIPARNHLGLTYLKMGLKDEARTEWERVLQINPRDSIASACLNMIKDKSNS
ncbi:tetratricopeptide repeat protein [bacterium]|nr:tetratricopeptide repeat protein [bacterium]